MKYFWFWEPSSVARTFYRPRFPVEPACHQMSSTDIWCPCCHIANKLVCMYNTNKLKCTMLNVVVPITKASGLLVIPSMKLSYSFVLLCCRLQQSSPIYNSSGYIHPCLSKGPTHTYMQALEAGRPLAYFQGCVFWVPCVKWVALCGDAFCMLNEVEN